MTIDLLHSPLTLTPIEFDPFAQGVLLSVVPVTEAQKEVWLSALMGEGANCAYNESQSLRFKGQLNIEILCRSIQSLVQRHEALRTLFSADGLSLCITESLHLEIPVVDLSEQRDRPAQLAAILGQVVREPFDLINGPLFRAQIVRSHPQEHLLILTAHHIICDGWSWGVLLPELAALYSAAHQGKMAKLEAPERFSDYARLQEEQAYSPEFAKAEQYWLKQFLGSVPVLELPLDHPRPALRTYSADRQDTDLNPDLLKNLKRLSGKARCSFFTLLLAGFEAFLHRLSRQSDIVIGVPAAGQSFWGKERLTGHCVNFLPMRSSMDEQSSFLDYVQSRRSDILDAYENQHITFGNLIKKLALPRDPSRVPLVSIVFNYDRALSGNDLPFTELEVELFSNPRAFETFDLFINASEADGKMVLECQYNTDLFEAETIRRRMAEFEVFLEGIVADPQRPIWQLPTLSPSEQDLLQTWNSTEAGYPSDQGIHQLFEAQVARTPEAIAIVDDQQSFTYAELNRRANQLARHLKTLGVGAEVLVGICVERSFEMLVGLLGILKAGGAYVPLDPAYPPERLAIILDDAQATVLLSQQSLRDTLPNHRAQTVFLDADWQTIAQQSVENLDSAAIATSLAYVIYTSGSTGRPKGVAIEHRNAVAFITWATEVFPPNTLTGVLASTSICFDLSVFELFFTLAVGGRVILAKNILHLPTLPAAQEVTLINTVPSAIAELLKLDRIPASVRTINLAGEALSNKLVQQLYQLKTVQQVFNLYGPSEDTTYSTVALMQRDSIQTPSIGQPIHNTKIYLLDAHLQPVPIGVPGELHISGAGLARGYLNRPDLTAEKFIPNPFEEDGAAPYTRLYKTGDLARYLPDGSIEYLGRIDHQIKLRGFRIELGEIEAVLTQQPSVQQAIVVVREDVPGNKRLVAYVVGRSGAASQTQTGTLPRELQTALRAKLPDYMVPSAIVVLEAMPLTPNGKLDRKVLPAPTMERADDQTGLIAARNQLELQLTKLWSKVLGVSSIGVTDNFFELGGHSLLATSLLAEIEKAFSQKLPLATIFQAPTIEQVAAILSRKTEDGSSHQSAASGAIADLPPCPSLVVIQPGSALPPLFCIHVLGRGLEFYRPMVGYLERSQPVYGLSTQIMEASDAPPNRVEDLAAFYVKEMRTLQPEGPYRMVGVSFGGVVAYEIAQQLHAQGQQVALLGLFDTSSSIPIDPPLQKRFSHVIEHLKDGRTDVLCRKLKLHLRTSLRDLNNSLKELHLKVYENFGQPLPTNLQNFRYEDLNDSALVNYQPQPYLGSAILFKSSDRTLAELSPERFDVEYGWRKLIGDRLEVHTITGDHLGMLREPNAQLLGVRLKECLAKALDQDA